MKRYDEALKLGEHVFHLQQRTLGEDHRLTMLSKHNLAYYYCQLGQ